MHPATSPDFVDGKPYLQRNALNPISTAEALRDELYDSLADCLRHAGIEALLAKSPPYSPTVWTKVEIWRRLPESEVVTGRSSATITIQPKPFHRFPHELSLEYQLCGRSRKAGPLSGIPDHVLPQLIGQLNGSMPIQRLPLPRLRTANWQLWRPRNKVDRVRVDPLRILSFGLLLIGIVLVASGVEAAVGSGILLLLAAVIGLVYWFREPRVVLSTGKPMQEPRQLIRMDSWQTVLRGVGSHEREVLAQLARELDQSRPAEATFGLEDIWYWGVDGKEERRQIVVTFRRALGFVQVYAYQKDLYVGWDVHVNGGTWSEVVVKDGIERGTGLRVVAHSIASAWHVPNEYDITDANYLGELIHAIVVERVKELMAEYRITQEIDFSILREDRRTVVGTEQKKKPKESRNGGARGLIRRLR